MILDDFQGLLATVWTWLVRRSTSASGMYPDASNTLTLRRAQVITWAQGPPVPQLTEAVPA